MAQPSKVKMAVIGTGGMGSLHVRDICDLENTDLAAVCDIDPQRTSHFAQKFGVPAFEDYVELLEKIKPDAVLIATPHYDHSPIAMAAFQRGIHVLTEKPIGVHVKAAREMIAAYEHAKTGIPNLVFGIMFQQRTYGFWRKIKSLIDDGELGRLVRATWIITDWFRTQSYYDNGGWRATWKGEGGGVLLNQCPHNLDLYQWFVGLPKKVAGFASIGKYHHIEVEDEVTAYFEYENGMVGHFITTTAESPGTNRLEIVGEKGKLIFEHQKLTFYRNSISMFEQIDTAAGGFDKVEYKTIHTPFQHHGQSGHKLVIENFADAIIQGDELIASGAEGLHSLMLGNAIMLSSFLGYPLELPMDEDLYAAKLQTLIENSRFEKTIRDQEISDLSKSF